MTSSTSPYICCRLYETLPTLSKNFYSDTTYKWSVNFAGTTTNYPTKDWITITPSTSFTLVAGTTYYLVFYRNNNDSSTNGWRFEFEGSVGTVISNISAINSQGHLVTEFGDSAFLYAPVIKINFSTSIMMWKPNYWTQELGETALNSLYDHPMCRQGDNCFIGDGSFIHVFNSVDDVSYEEASIGSEYYINWIKATSDKVYAGGINSSDPNKESIVIEYDFFSKQGRKFVIPEGGTIGFIWNNIAFIIDSKGNIRQFNGNEFVNVAQFSSANIQDIQFILPHRNGITSESRKIYILNNYTKCLPYNRNIYGGIWCFEPDTRNLYRTIPVSFNFVDYFFPSGAIDPRAYDDMSGFTSGALMSIYGNQQKFFAGLVATYDDSGTVTNSFICCTEKIKAFNSYNSTIKSGYFITPKISSKEINDKWKHLIVKYSPSIGGLQTGKIVVKYKCLEPTVDYSTPVPITFTSFWNKFTCSSSSLPSFVTIGTDVTIISGAGSGFTSEVLSITGTTTKTITLKDTIGVYVISNTATAIFENWTTIATTTDNTKDFVQCDIPDNAVSDWIMFKIYIEGAWDIDELQLATDPNLSIDQIT